MGFFEIGGIEFLIGRSAGQWTRVIGQCAELGVASTSGLPVCFSPEIKLGVCLCEPLRWSGDVDIS